MKRGLIVAGAILLVLAILGARVFVLYRNRWGRQSIIRRDVYQNFELMRRDLAHQGVDVEITGGWRGEVEQQEHLAAGTSRARWGLSPHNYGVAFDLVPVVNGAATWDVPTATWKKIGEAGKRAGLVWGGDFKTIVDRPHFELAGWRSMNLALLPTAPGTMPA